MLVVNYARAGRWLQVCSLVCRKRAALFLAHVLDRVAAEIVRDGYRGAYQAHNEGKAKDLEEVEGIEGDKVEGFVKVA